MSESSQLVFYGEILPGHDAATVQTKLGELLKLPAEQIAAVFSGRRIVLRKSLPNEQAASYVARLEKIGVKVFAEAMPQLTVAASLAPAAVPAAPQAAADMPPQSAPLAATAAAPSPERLVPPAPGTPALALAPAAPAEEMDCPKCGERQPRRTLCRTCSVDMKRFLEAQQQAVREINEEKALARAVAGRVGTSAAPGEAFVGEPEQLSFFSLNFSGRIGRANYLVGGWFFSSALMMLALWLAAKTDIWTIAVIGIVASLVLGLRFSILRCHDANWSGWLSVILLIPYVGGLFGLVLLFMPGTRGDNNYGTATRRVGWPIGLGMVAICGLSVYLFAGQTLTLYQAYLTKAGGASSLQMQGGQKAGAYKLPTVDTEVLIYTTAEDCDECRLVLSYLRDHGITWTERMVDRREDYFREFLAAGGRDVPYIVVGEQTMSGYDPEQLDLLLGNRR